MSEHIQFTKQRVLSNDVEPDDADVGHNAPIKPVDDTQPVTPPTDTPNPTTPPVEFKTEGLEQVLIEVDGKETNLYLNDKGDAVDDKGQVIYTKDQLEDTSNEFDVLLETPKFEIKTDKGEPKQYEKSAKGLQDYLDDVYKKGISDAVAENNETVFLNNLYNKYPIVKDVLSYVEKNGNLRGFNTDLDLNKEPTKDDLPYLRLLIREDRIKKGESVTEADTYVDYLETQGKLFDIATGIRTKVLENKAKQDELDEIAKKDWHKSYWGIDQDTNTPVQTPDSFYDIIINKKKITVDGADLSIPDVIKVKTGEGSYVTKTKEDFFKFIYETKPYKIDNKNYLMTEYAYRGYLKDTKRNSNPKHYDIFDALESFIGENPFGNDSVNQKTNFDAIKRKIVKSSDGSLNKPGGKVKFIKRQSSSNID